jgi:HD-GYP domain-containing protein (c-di-GMP phosphodiesterase class II)
MSSDRPSGAPSPTPESIGTLGAPLLEALESHLPGAGRHAEATAGHAMAVARALGLGADRAALVRETGRLHDVGMVYVPVATLRKPHAELTDDDRRVLASHIEAGSQLALGAGLAAEVCKWILDTRERWNGGGPAGLAGEAIALESRIVRVACATDLMLATAGAEPTVAGLRAAAGTELDPRVVEVLAARLSS